MKKDIPLDELFELSEVAQTLLSLTMAVSLFNIPKNVNTAIAFRLMANTAMGNSVLGKDPIGNSEDLAEAVMKEIEFIKQDMK